MICIAENNGEGGIAGGAGVSGQASQNATGSAAHGYGWPVIECVTGTPCEFMIQLTKDYEGNVPSDLSAISTVTFEARASMNSTRPAITVPCTFSEDGIVSLALTEKELDYHNGVWFGEFRCTDKDGHDRQNYRAYLVIRKGTKGANETTPETITVMDVRMALMDTTPNANELLNDLEFSDVQILHAVERCIREFNELPPAISVRYDATSFPWMENLLKGVIGFLMQEKAYQFTRNRMQYSAAGFTLDRADKGPAYAQLAQAARMEWKQFIATKKSELNAAECFGTISIPYFETPYGVESWQTP